MEKQFLINQLKMDKHVLFLIKDYVFETILTRDKRIRYKERNLYYLRERVNVKTRIFEMGETNEIIEMPNLFYMKIDEEYDHLVSHLNDCWVEVENHLEFLWKKYDILREKAPPPQAAQGTRSQDLRIAREDEMALVLSNASTYDASCWQDCYKTILNTLEEFDMMMTPFNNLYFICNEGRDVYTLSFTEDGLPSLRRAGVLDKDDDTILIDRHSWWKEIRLPSGEVCSVNPSTGAIYNHWSYKTGNIIGAMYHNEIVLF